MSALTTPSGSRKKKKKGHFNQASIGNAGWERRKVLDLLDILWGHLEVHQLTDKSKKRANRRKMRRAGKDFVRGHKQCWLGALACDMFL